MRVEDYAVIGDTHTVALVSSDGSIDWLCLPQFDSGACFANLLGSPSNGRWQLAPTASSAKSTRRYRENTLILETDFETAGGAVRVVDCMPLRDDNPDVIRIVEGLAGTVTMRSELLIRYDYGRILPWVRSVDGRLRAVAGADALVLESPIKHRGEHLSSVAEFQVSAGERVPFVLTWHPSYAPAPPSPEAFRAVEETAAWWRSWVARCTDQGEYRELIARSLITLKALTFAPSGAIVAAGTCSLPEALGGTRNWDYRYCWIRDATFTLYAFLHGGYVGEAKAFEEWLLRAVAGDPSELQVMYGILGKRRLHEWTADWLSGYEGSKPVRIGNAAAEQLQLDVYGELIDALHQARKAGLHAEDAVWALEKQILSWLENNWRREDSGLWEVRGKPHNFTHSKVMSWVAFDRAVKAVEDFGLAGPVEDWRKLRDEIHRDVCKHAWNSELGSFTQYYGSTNVDASLLLLPIVGFLPATDERMLGTLRRIEQELVKNGFVLRYDADAEPDGLPGQEGAFLACSFWLVDVYVLCGRMADARALFRRLVSVSNGLGLLSEEYDSVRARLVGNFPQAFSHVALVNSARNLTSPTPPVNERSR